MTGTTRWMARMIEAGEINFAIMDSLAYVAERSGSDLTPVFIPASNGIPGTALVSLDIRHPRDAGRNTAVDALLAMANAIAARRGLTATYVREMDQPAVPMDERLTSFVVEAIDASAEKGKYPRVVEAHGDSPPQYPDYDEQDDRDDDDD